MRWLVVLLLGCSPQIGQPCRVQIDVNNDGFTDLYYPAQYMGPNEAVYWAKDPLNGQVDTKTFVGPIVVGDRPGICIR